MDRDGSWDRISLPASRKVKRSVLAGGLRLKLLLSYLLVVAVGIIGLFIGVRLVAPPLFDRIVTHMNGNGMGPGHGAGVGTGVDQGVRNAFGQAVLQALLISGLASLIVAIVVSLFVSGRITAPLTSMVRSSRRLASGDFKARVKVTDQDELGELAESFNEMAAKLEDSEQRRVKLIGDVAHELRTPLATLSGYLEGLLDDVVEPSPELWAQLHGEVTRLTRLTGDLQELSRVESGQVKLDRRSIPAAELARAVVAGMSPAFTDKGVGLRLDAPDDLPDVLVDRDRIHQVLTNLLANALRHTPAGGIVTVDTISQPDTVEFRVTDNGSGISAEHLDRIFERFYRVDPARSRASGGSGIGLTIARALVEAHGGRIWVESPGVNQGSTFGFTVPRERLRGG